MIRVLILEDEPAALRRIKRLIQDIRPDYNIVGDADNIEEAVECIESTSADLIISDVQLSDGLCFEAFDKTEYKAPIIFITAYDEYAIRAFDFHGIHYLVKPVLADKLNEAFNKFEALSSATGTDQTKVLKSEMVDGDKKLLSKIGNKTTIIDIRDIAFIYFENRASHAVNFKGQIHFLDQSLDHLTSYLPANQFFRVNRQTIINRAAVKSMQKRSSNRLGLLLNVITDLDIVVSKDNSPAFKDWIKGV